MRDFRTMLNSMGTKVLLEAILNGIGTKGVNCNYTIVVWFGIILNSMRIIQSLIIIIIIKTKNNLK